MATRRICVIEGCCKPVRARGWCTAHYARWQKYGDPLGGGAFYAPRGAGIGWLQENVGYSGDECLVWPFARTSCGYGNLVINGKNKRASRVMCEMAHGAAPTPNHEAAHSCGKGHEGCCNPRHLRWDTRKGNESDKIEHGTLTFGEKNGFAKLTADGVCEIRRRAGRETQRNLAKEFGVSSSQISRIAKRTRWAWLDDDAA